MIRSNAGFTYTSGRSGRLTSQIVIPLRTESKIRRVRCNSSLINRFCRSSAPFACNNTQFLTAQSEFAAGTITVDQLVDICGSVTQVLASKKTSSGTHGYFYVQMPSGYRIEIVSNLDAMAEASTDRPPTTWPWVAVGDYVYVQGRYYYDSSSSQGVDWTEDDTDSSWSHTGYVAVCNSSGASCSKYW